MHQNTNSISYQYIQVQYKYNTQNACHSAKVGRWRQCSCFERPAGRVWGPDLHLLYPPIAIFAVDSVGLPSLRTEYYLLDYLCRLKYGVFGICVVHHLRHGVRSTKEANAIFRFYILINSRDALDEVLA